MENLPLQQLRLPLYPQLLIWDQLPTATQKKLSELCVRLILQHIEEAETEDDDQDPT